MTTDDNRTGVLGVRFLGPRVAGALLAVVLVLAGCSSGSSSGGGSGTTSAGMSATSAATVVETHSGPMGTFLTDASGRSLYMFAADTAKKSACSGSCTIYWTPLATTGAPSASGSAATSKLATIKRSDGTVQVTYAGHPLYTYKGDTAAGDTTGQGSNGFGAKWWLLAPSGQPIEGAPSSTPSSSTSGGGGGGWA